MARPSSYDPACIETVRDMVLSGATDDEIANALGVARSTLALWKVKYPEFSDALKAWKDEADDAVEQSLYRKAVAGDTTACIFWLKNRRSGEWRDVAKTEITHSGSVDMAVNLAALNPDQLRVLASIPLTGE